MRIPITGSRRRRIRSIRFSSSLDPDGNYPLDRQCCMLAHAITLSFGKVIYSESFRYGSVIRELASVSSELADRSADCSVGERDQV